jgi:hypothetical protein
MAVKITRNVKKLTTFLSVVSISAFSATIGCLNIKYFNAIPKLIKMSNINITTSQAINVFIRFHHEN